MCPQQPMDNQYGKECPVSHVDREHIAGIGQEIVGQVTQVVGRLRGDPAQESQGMLDQAEGQEQQDVGGLAGPASDDGLSSPDASR